MLLRELRTLHRNSSARLLDIIILRAFKGSLRIVFWVGCSEPSRLRWVNDSDLDKDDARRNGLGPQTIALPDQCDADVRTLVCGLPVEPPH